MVLEIIYIYYIIYFLYKYIHISLNLYELYVSIYYCCYTFTLLF